MDPYGSYTVNIGFCQNPVLTVDSVKELTESSSSTGYLVDCAGSLWIVMNHENFSEKRWVTESTIYTGSCDDCAGSLWMVMDPFNLLGKRVHRIFVSFLNSKKCRLNGSLWILHSRHRILSRSCVDCRL